MRGAPLVLLIAMALAGCLDGTGTGLDGAQPVAKVPVQGQVLTPAFNPIPNALVVLENPGTLLDDGTKTADITLIEATTDADGYFAIQSYPGTHVLRVTHPNYEAHTSNVSAPGANLTIRIAPLPAQGPVPFQVPLPFDGYIECAFEALIITPSCDTAAGFAGAPQPFQDDSVFTIDLDTDWATVVLDVHFDGSDHPGLAGMRASAYAAESNAEVLDYQRITQTWGPESFTLRISPATDYGDAVPSPEGAGPVRFEFFGHGHGDDTVCTPGDETCFLGVGMSQGLQFQAIATVFYHEAAPEGWTLLAS